MSGRAAHRFAVRHREAPDLSFSRRHGGFVASGTAAPGAVTSAPVPPPGARDVRPLGRAAERRVTSGSAIFARGDRPARLASGSMIDETSALRLEPVTPDNVDAAIGLRVHPHQADNVAPVVRSLAEAYAYGDGAWPRLIFDGDRLVGFLMAFVDLQWAPGRDPADRRSGLWRLNIGAEHQGRGYGRYAVRAVGEELRRRGATEMYVSWHRGEHGPGDFYRGLGFRETGELSGDQLVGVLDLRGTGAGTRD